VTIAARDQRSGISKALAVVDRMRLIFVGAGVKSVSEEIVLKWAREIEAAVKKEAE